MVHRSQHEVATASAADTRRSGTDLRNRVVTRVPDAAKTIPADPLRRPVPPQREGPSMQTYVVAAASFLFEISTALLHMLDVVSDLVVGHQFYATPGQMTWFWMVVASIFVSNCLYSIMVVKHILERRYGTTIVQDKTFWGLCLLLFPIAQVVPLLQWLSEMFPSKHMLERERKKRRDANLSRQDSRSARTPPDVRTAVREELGDDESRQPLRVLLTALENFQESHEAFYAQAMVQAVPQSVIQLLAFIHLGEATSVQLVSIGLSLFTIVSKAHVVCVALDLRAMVWKASLVAYDVFSTFFVFSTLVASNHAGDSKHASKCSAWTAVWVMTTHSVSYLAALLAAGWVVCVLALMRWKVVSLVSLAVALFMFAGIVNALGRVSSPTVLLLVGVKLSGLLIWFDQHELTGDKTDLPFFALGWHFVSRGFAESNAEGTRRLKHFLTWCLDAQVNSAGEGSYARYKAAAAKDQIDLNRLTIWDCRMPTEEDFSNRRYVPDVQEDILPVLHRRDVAQLQQRPPWSVGFLDDLRRDHLRAQGVKRVCAGIDLVVCALLFTMAVLALLFNLAFPFLHTWLYGWSSLNVLQAACLVSSAVALCVCVSGLRHGYHYVNFVFTVRQLLLSQSGCSFKPEMMCHMVAAYCRPSHCTALQRYVSTAVLPHEVVVEYVAAYLAPSDVDLSELSAAECARLRPSSF